MRFLFKFDSSLLRMALAIIRPEGWILVRCCEANFIVCVNELIAALGVTGISWRIPMYLWGQSYRVWNGFVVNSSVENKANNWAIRKNKPVLQMEWQELQTGRECPNPRFTCSSHLVTPRFESSKFPPADLFHHLTDQRVRTSFDANLLQLRLQTARHVTEASLHDVRELIQSRKVK